MKGKFWCKPKAKKFNVKDALLFLNCPIGEYIET
jgi:hypothetical protein